MNTYIHTYIFTCMWEKEGEESGCRGRKPEKENKTWRNSPKLVKPGSILAWYCNVVMTSFWFIYSCKHRSIKFCTSWISSHEIFLPSLLGPGEDPGLEPVTAALTPCCCCCCCKAWCWGLGDVAADGGPCTDEICVENTQSRFQHPKKGKKQFKSPNLF